MFIILYRVYDENNLNNFDKHDLDVSIIILGIYLDRLKNKSDSENVSGKLPDM